MRPEVHLAKRLYKIFCLRLVSWEHRQQYRSIRANLNERVKDVTSPAGRDLQLAVYVCRALNLLLYRVDHADLSLAWIQPRLCWGRERGVFDPSSVCLFKTSIGFWRERGVYCRLHSQSTADTVPPQSLPVLCFVDRRDEAAEAAGKIAKSSGDSAAVPRTKGKRIRFTSDTMVVAFVRTPKRQWKLQTLWFA